jgi:hypothetical protein
MDQMITHSRFSNPILSELGHYSVRESLDNEKYEKIIEVTLTMGQVGHIEVRSGQSYCCQAGTFDTREEAIDTLVKLLQTQNASQF